MRTILSLPRPKHSGLIEKSSILMYPGPKPFTTWNWRKYLRKRNVMFRQPETYLECPLPSKWAVTCVSCLAMGEPLWPSYVPDFQSTRRVLWWRSVVAVSLQPSVPDLHHGCRKGSSGTGSEQQFNLCITWWDSGNMYVIFLSITLSHDS